MIGLDVLTGSNTCITSSLSDWFLALESNNDCNKLCVVQHKREIALEHPNSCSSDFFLRHIEPQSARDDDPMITNSSPSQAHMVPQMLAFSARLS